MKRYRPTRLALLAAVLAICPACVEKTIGVRSDPPGATVYLDGKEIGSTPIENIPFHFYGTREFWLIRDGHRAERRVVHISAPWYSSFPADLFTELLWPWTLHDRRHYYVRLKPTAPVETAALTRHAQDTRDIARARIAGARNSADYKPPAYLVKGKDRPFVLFGLFSGPPRVTPDYAEPEAEK